MKKELNDTIQKLSSQWYIIHIEASQYTGFIIQL